MRYLVELISISRHGTSLPGNIKLGELTMQTTGVIFITRQTSFCLILHEQINSLKELWWLMGCVHYNMGDCNAIGLILALCLANERQCYFVTLSLIGWAQAQNRHFAILHRTSAPKPEYKYGSDFKKDTPHHPHEWSFDGLLWIFWRKLTRVIMAPYCIIQ